MSGHWPTAADIDAAAAVLRVPKCDVIVLVKRPYDGTLIPTRVKDTAGDIECDDCHAPPGEPCDMTIEH